MGLPCWLAMLMGSCDRDEIHTYRVEKVPQDSAPETGRRMIAAIVPRKEKTWFFKVMGSEEAVSERKGEIERFLRSLKFSSDSRLEWTLPEGWVHRPGSGMRHATLEMGTGARKLELTVVPLGPEAAAVLPNVNRWRDQLGLPPITEAELPECTTQFRVDDSPAVLVDISTASRTGREHRGKGAIRYSVPEGWKPLANPGSMRVAAFQLEAGGRQAEVTVVALGAASGDLLANVNRWRGQIGLSPIGRDELARCTRPFETGSSAATCVDVEGGGARIVAVILPRGDKTWFFKLWGPRDLVEAEKNQFEAFVRSVNFE